MDLHRHPITWQLAARISATRHPVSTTSSGGQPIPPPTARRCRIRRKSPGTTLVPAVKWLNLKAIIPCPYGVALLRFRFRRSIPKRCGGGGGPGGCATGSSPLAVGGGSVGVVGGGCAGYAKPTWQSILGNPNNGVRDVLDVSLFAGDGVWGHSYPLFSRTLQWRVALHG